MFLISRDFLAAERMKKWSGSASMKLEYSRPLPTWEDVLRYEKTSASAVFDNDEDLNGYPRWCLHSSVKRLCDVLGNKYSKENEKCLCFPSYGVAKRCREYIKKKEGLNTKVRILQLATSKPLNSEEMKSKCEFKIAVVFVTKNLFHHVRQYWKLTGEIVSPRLADYILNELFIAERSSFATISNGKNKDQQMQNKKSQINFTLANRALACVRKRLVTNVIDANDELGEDNYHFQNDDDDDMEPTFLDTVRSNDNVNVNNHTRIDDQLLRNGFEFSDSEDEDTINHNNPFGDSTDSEEDDAFVSLVPPEPIAIDISDTPIDSPLPDSSNNASATFIDPSAATIANDNIPNDIDPEDEVFIFPSGIASIFTAQRVLQEYDLLRVNRIRYQTESSNGTGTQKRIVLLGDICPDIVKMFQEFNDVIIINNQKGAFSTLNDLEVLLNSGEQILSVFLAIPTNPCLELTNLQRLKELSDLFVFPIIFDISMGSGVLNYNILKYGDIICMSLLTRFTNIEVMAGAMIVSKKRSPKFHEFFLSRMNEELLESQLQNTSQQTYSQNQFISPGATFWVEDAVLLDRGSCKWHDRNIKINYTAEYLVKRVLRQHEGKVFKRVLYLNDEAWQENNYYNMVKYSREDCGYGGIIAIEFEKESQLAKFYDSIEHIYKGTPVLGGNDITTVAAFREHNGRHLLRVCVGLENIKILTKVFQSALSKI